MEKIVPCKITFYLQACWNSESPPPPLVLESCCELYFPWKKKKMKFLNSPCHFCRGYHFSNCIASLEMPQLWNIIMWCRENTMLKETYCGFFTTWSSPQLSNNPRPQPEGVRFLANEPLLNLPPFDSICSNAQLLLPWRPAAKLSTVQYCNSDYYESVKKKKQVPKATASIDCSYFQLWVQHFSHIK